VNGGLGGWTLHEQIEAAAAWHVDPKTATAIADEVAALRAKLAPRQQVTVAGIRGATDPYADMSVADAAALDAYETGQ
jgi:hypothetical protein